MGTCNGLGSPPFSLGPFLLLFFCVMLLPLLAVGHVAEGVEVVKRIETPPQKSLTQRPDPLAKTRS